MGKLEERLKEIPYILSRALIYERKGKDYHDLMYVLCSPKDNNGKEIKILINGRSLEYVETTYTLYVFYENNCTWKSINSGFPNPEVALEVAEKFFCPRGSEII